MSRFIATKHQIKLNESSTIPCASIPIIHRQNFGCRSTNDALAMVKHYEKLSANLDKDRLSW
jgi:hypothetical protein